MIEMRVEATVIFLGVLLVLMASLPIWKLFFSIEILTALDLLLIIFFYLFFFSRAKKLLGKDFNRYLLFFSLWLAIVQFAVFSIFLFKPMEINIGFFIAIVAALLVLSLFSRFALGKNEVEGMVLLSDSESATVEIGFDLFAGLNYGKYFVKADKKYPKGEKVRVALKRKFLRKVPERIIGKAEK